MIASKAFIDTAPFIYIMDKSPEFVLKTEKIIEKLQKQNVSFITSVITYTEYTVKPKELNNKKAVDDFKNFLSEIDCFVSPITFDIADMASNLRAKYSSLKAMDSIQIAVALYQKCDVFITNDKKLKNIEEIDVVLIEELQ